MFKEHRSVNFVNNALPSKRYNFAFCQVSDLGEEQGGWEFLLYFPKLLFRNGCHAIQNYFIGIKFVLTNHVAELTIQNKFYY